MTTIKRGTCGLVRGQADAFAASYYSGHLEVVGLRPLTDSWPDQVSLPTDAHAGFGSITGLTYLLQYDMVMPGGSHAAGATGAYDAWCDQFIANVSASTGPGAANVVVVIGPEFDVQGYAWSAAGYEASFATHWARLATKFHAAGIRTCFCPSTSGRTAVGLPDNVPTPASCLPSNLALIDFYGVTLFDFKLGDTAISAVDRWSGMLTRSYGLNFWQAQAKADNKQMIVWQWGLNFSGDSQANVAGGGDNPTFVTSSAAWVAANNCYAFCAFDVDNATFPVATSTTSVIPAADGTPDPTMFSSVHGANATATAINIASNRLRLTSGGAGNGVTADRAYLRDIADAAKTAGQVRGLVQFDSGSSIAEMYISANAFDPSVPTAFATGLQLQVGETQWRLGYRLSSGFVTLTSGTWSKTHGTDFGVLFVASEVPTSGGSAGTQALAAYVGTAAQYLSDPNSMPLLTSASLSATVRSAIPAGTMGVQQLGNQSATAAVRWSDWGDLDFIPGVA